MLSPAQDLLSKSGHLASDEPFQDAILAGHCGRHCGRGFPALILGTVMSVCSVALLASAAAASTLHGLGPRSTATKGSLLRSSCTNMEQQNVYCYLLVVLVWRESREKEKKKKTPLGLAGPQGTEI